MLFLAGSVPTGVAAVAIAPAATGDVAVFAASLAITRLILAGANAVDGGLRELLRGRIAVSYGISAALFVVSIWTPEPFRYALWAFAIALESGALLHEDRQAARRGAASAASTRSRRATRMRRWTRTTSPSASGCS